jgi:hypothetical protein
MTTSLRIVFDGPPSPEGGRFVEVEDAAGNSVNAGTWHERPDGLWELRLAPIASEHQVDFDAWWESSGPNVTNPYEAAKSAWLASEHPSPSEDRRDAERYRWLRQQHWTTGGLVVTQPSSVKLGSFIFSIERLDEVVDDAMSALASSATEQGDKA